MISFCNLIGGAHARATESQRFKSLGSFEARDVIEIHIGDSGLLKSVWRRQGNVVRLFVVL